MNRYSLDNEKRTRIFYLIAIAAIVLTPLLNTGISLLSKNIPALSFLDKTFYIQGFVIFGLLIFLFDNYFWKIQTVSGVPNLSGTYEGQYVRYEIGKELSATEIDALFKQEEEHRKIRVTITQTWQKIHIYWEGTKSVSFSCNVDLKVENNKIYQLQWTFDSKDRTGITQKNKYGIGVSTCVIKDESNFEEIEGTYFTQKLNRGYFKLNKTNNG